MMQLFANIQTVNHIRKKHRHKYVTVTYKRLCLLFCQKAPPQTFSLKVSLRIAASHMHLNMEPTIPIYICS